MSGSKLVAALCAALLVAAVVDATTASANEYVRYYGVPSKPIRINHGRTRIGAVYVGGVFNDGGGTIIAPTKTGGIWVGHVPPRQPAFQGALRGGFRR